MTPELKAIFWAAITLVIYIASIRINKRFACRWASPLLLTWLGCAVLLIALHANYKDYLSGTHWLIVLLGPATMAFAVPIHENRDIIRKHWFILFLGTLVGSGIAILSAVILAWAFKLSPEITASLLPRSITTPFAVSISQGLGGVPELTAAFTAITGILGAMIGELLLAWLPLRSSFAKGALLGMGAHAAGVAKARELGKEEGIVAGLIMVFAGLLNLLGVLVFLKLR